MTSPWRKSIPPTERASLQILPLFWSLVLVAGAATALYFVIKARGDPAGMGILGVLVLIGCALTVWQGIKFMALLQAGAARLELQEAPPTVGGRIKGRVRLPASAAQASRVMVELLCFRDGNSNRVAPNEFSSGKVWTTQHEFSVRHADGAAAAEFEFAIPATCLPSGSWDSGRDNESMEEHSIGWQVCASAVVGHKLVEHRFDVKVPLPRSQTHETPVDLLRDFAAIALILANLVPVLMVLKGRADVASIAFLYWTENLVIAGYMFLRVLLAARGDVADKLGGVLFFAIWLGGVSIFLGLLLVGSLLNPPKGWDQLTREQFERGDSYEAHLIRQVLGRIGTHLVEAGLVIAVLSLVASHGVGFVQNYIRNGRYLQARVNEEVRHIMNRSLVTFGAIFVLLPLAQLASPKYVLAALVVAKTGFELWRYAHEQRTAATNAGRSIITT